MMKLVVMLVLGSQCFAGTEPANTVLSGEEIAFHENKILIKQHNDWIVAAVIDESGRCCIPQISNSALKPRMAGCSRVDLSWKHGDDEFTVSMHFEADRNEECKTDDNTQNAPTDNENDDSWNQQVEQTEK